MRNLFIFFTGMIVGAFGSWKLTSRVYDESKFISSAAGASIMASALNQYESGTPEVTRKFLESEMESGVISLINYEKLYFFQNETRIQEFLQKVADYRKSHPNDASTDTEKVVDSQVDKILERVLNGSAPK